MTLEERAKEYADLFVAGECTGLSALIHSVAEKAHFAGGHEQKAIDDKECESLVGLAVKEARQVFIDKACEWLETTLPNIEYISNASALRQTKRQYIDTFRKAMTKED